MRKEQYAMDIEELREYNATLRSEVKQSRAAIAKAEKKAAAAESELKRRMHTYAPCSYLHSRCHIIMGYLCTVM